MPLILSREKYSQSNRSRVSKTRRPRTVLLEMKKTNQQRYVEKREIYNHNNVHSNASEAFLIANTNTFENQSRDNTLEDRILGSVKILMANHTPVTDRKNCFLDQKISPRTVPNILRNSTGKLKSDSLLASYTSLLKQHKKCNTNDRAEKNPTLLDISDFSNPSSFEMCNLKSKKESHKRKQVYTERNIRQESPCHWNSRNSCTENENPLDKESKEVPSTSERTKKDEEETLRTLKKNTHNEIRNSPNNTEEIQNNYIPSSFLEKEMKFSTLTNTMPNKSLQTDFTSWQEALDSFDELIDYSSNQIFNKHQYDCYSDELINRISDSLGNMNNVDNAYTNNILESYNNQCIYAKNLDENGNIIREQSEISSDNLRQINIYKPPAINQGGFGHNSAGINNSIIENNDKLDAAIENSNCNIITEYSLSENSSTSLYKSDQESTDALDTEINLTNSTDPFDSNFDDQYLDCTYSSELLIKETEEIYANGLLSMEHSEIDKELTEEMLTNLINEVYASNVDNILNENFEEMEIPMNSTLLVTERLDDHLASINFDDEETDSAPELEIENSEKNFRVFQCMRCFLGFASSRALAIHEGAAHKGLYNISCESCGRRFNRQYTFNRHLIHCGSSRVPHKCDFCPKMYRYKSSLVHHMRREHDSLIARPRDKKFTCHICSKAYCRQGFYENHLKSHQVVW